MEDHWAGRPPSHFEVVQKAPQAAAIAGKTNPHDPILVLEDDWHNKQVLNDPLNGILAGELVLTRSNPDYRKTGAPTAEQRWLYDFYDLSSMQWAVLIRQRKTLLEQAALASDEAIIRLVVEQLGQVLNPQQQAELKAALARIQLRHARVRDANKLAMLALVGAGLEETDSVGRRNPQAKRAQLTKATREIRARMDRLAVTEDANRGRKDLVDNEVAWQVTWTRNLVDWLMDGHSPARQPGIFAGFIGPIRYKPELLTINNAWHRRDQPDVHIQLRQGLAIFCKLYDPMMHPFRIIVRLARAELAARAEDVVAMLDDLATVVNLAIQGLSGDHQILLSRFGAFVTGCREAMIQGDLDHAKDMAGRGIHLLRYRVLPGTITAPPEWYTPPRLG